MTGGLHDGEEARMWAILNGGKLEGKQRAAVTSDGAAWRLMFTLAIEAGMRARASHFNAGSG